MDFGFWVGENLIMTLSSCTTEDKTVDMKEKWGVHWLLTSSLWWFGHVEDKLAEDIKDTAKSKQGIC